MTENNYPAIHAVPIEKPVHDATSPSNTSKPNEPTIETHETSERPPSLQTEPYLVKMLEIGEAKSHFEMPSLLKEINEFVLSEIERQKLDDDNKSYEEVVNHYLDKLKLPEGVDQYLRTEKLNELMMIDKRLIEAMIAKEELLKKPISELSSKQLRDRIEGK